MSSSFSVGKAPLKQTLEVQLTKIIIFLEYEACTLKRRKLMNVFIQVSVGATGNVRLFYSQCKVPLLDWGLLRTVERVNNAVELAA